MAGEGQFDVHSSGGFTLEFNLDSSSSSFLLYHICSNTVYLTNVPVPASNLREWKFVKTSTYFLIYCDGIYVGSMSQSDQCFSDSTWNSFLGRGLNFCCGDVVTKYYRIVPSEYICKVVLMLNFLNFSKNQPNEYLHEIDIDQQQ